MWRTQTLTSHWCGQHVRSGDVTGSPAGRPASPGAETGSVGKCGDDDRDGSNGSGAERPRRGEVPSTLLKHGVKKIAFVPPQNTKSGKILQ